jgi:GT2 family glycosyltransferase
MDFTVAIRAYNASARLPQILDHLRVQTDTERMFWEVLVVDNNSTDQTAKIINDYQRNWLDTVPIRYVLEPQQGAVFARKRAIQEAKGTWVGFLDDDNLPSSNWVAAAYHFAQTHTEAVAYGSRVRGKFEVEPPHGFERIQSFLAIKERGDYPSLYQPSSLSLPAGAGLVVKRQAWLEYVSEQFQLKGPVGQSLVAKGEDFEALLKLSQAGEIWYNPAMVIEHEIPAWRLEKDYLIHLVSSVGLTVCQLRMIQAKSWQKPFIILQIILGSLRRMIRHLIQYKGKVRTDPVATCEMAFYASTFLSPWYVLKGYLASIFPSAHSEKLIIHEDSHL